MAALVAALAGCGGKKEPPAPTGPPTTFRAYFLHQRRVQPVRRTVPHTAAVVAAALQSLAQGPTSQEATALGLVSQVGSDELGVTVANGVAKVDGILSHDASAQVVYTLTQFPTVEKVEISGKAYTRKDFESLTPSILVETPLPYQRVTTPLHAAGTANTFEATFQYELRDHDGKVVARHFVTATSGTGTRGTWTIRIPFSFHHPGLGELVVYELSAENGSRIHQVEIPVRLAR